MYSFINLALNDISSYREHNEILSDIKIIESKILAAKNRLVVLNDPNCVIDSSLISSIESFKRKFEYNTKQLSSKSHDLVYSLCENISVKPKELARELGLQNF